MCRSSISGYTPNYAQMYVPFAEAGFSESIHTYCAIWQKGSVLHPGTKTGPAITFIVPAKGTVTYEAAVRGGGNGGDYFTVWLNDEMIYPASGDWNDAIFKNATSDNPAEATIPSLKVEEGDVIRMCVMAVGGSRSSRASYIVKHPTVTYTECVLPIGNPNGVPPTDIITTMKGKNTSDTEVMWKESAGAAGYNIYVKNLDADSEAVKVNSEPITALQYTITGLDFNTMYEMTMTSVTKDGKESEHTDAVAFKTPKGADKDDDKTSDKTSDADKDDSKLPVNNDGNNNDKNNTNKKEPVQISWVTIVIIAVAVVFVLLIAAVVVLLILLSKKKAAAVPAPAVEAAPAVAPSEEKKDEE